MGLIHSARSRFASVAPVVRQSRDRDWRNRRTVPDWRTTDAENALFPLRQSPKATDARLAQLTHRLACTGARAEVFPAEGGKILRSTASPRRAPGRGRMPRCSRRCWGPSGWRSPLQTTSASRTALASFGPDAAANAHHQEHETP